MNLRLPFGTIKSVGYASVFINDFAQYRETNLPGTGWALWPNVGPLHRAQTLLIDLHASALKDVEKVRENADLTVQAKTRRSLEVFNIFADGVLSTLPSLAQTAEHLHTYAADKLVPVQQLASGDAVSAALDAECRAYVLKLETVDRANLIAQMRQGNEPRITAAILRGPATVSGLTSDQLVALSAAGIAVAYKDAVITLAKLAIGIREVQRLAEGLGKDIIRAGVGIDGSTKDTESWTKPSSSLEALLAWLSPIPLEIRDQVRVREAAANTQDSDAEADAA